MLTQRPSLLIALVAGLLIVVAGCSDDRPADPAGSTGGDDFTAIDFNAAFGGLTMTDETPGFGDPDLLDAEGDAEAAGEAYDDPWADDPDVRALIDRDDPGRPQMTFVQILWGRLGEEADVLMDNGEVDWSGELTVDRGIVLVRRVIGFFGPENYIVRPRPDRQTVVWESHVARGHQGLLIQIIEPAHRDGDPEPEPNMLHFTTGPFTESFAVCDLAEFEMVYPVEGTDQAISFRGFTLDNAHPCPQGNLMGRWLGPQEEGDTHGVFMGRWVALQGPVMGYLRGAWGVNDAGEKVFFGKYIRRDGCVLGLLAGRWEPSDRPGFGLFRGRWHGRNDEVLGTLNGHYRMAGTFQGRWSAICD